MRSVQRALMTTMFGSADEGSGKGAWALIGGAKPDTFGSASARRKRSWLQELRPWPLQKPDRYWSAPWPTKRPETPVSNVAMSGCLRLCAVSPLRAGALSQFELLYALRRMEGEARRAAAGEPRTRHRTADSRLGSAVGARRGAAVWRDQRIDQLAERRVVGEELLLGRVLTARWAL